jgi:3-oxoacyl-[acyl-carrier-protein] synthase-1
VGVGACTAIGASAASTAAAVRAGIAGFCEHPYMVDTAGNKMVVAMAPYLPLEVEGVIRFVQLALPAAGEALNALHGVSAKISAISVIVGLPPQRPGLPAELGAYVSEGLNSIADKEFLVQNVQTMEAGHSAGLMAVEAGCRLVRAGGAEFCLVGGVDSYIAPETLEWLEDCDQLHSAGELNNAWGFVPGEAAGFCLLASEKARQRCGLNALAKVVSACVSSEKNLIKTKTVCIGEGLTAAIRRVLQDLPRSQDRVDGIICDMNGEEYRAIEFGFASVRVSERFVDIADFLAPADCWGDVGAASGPLFLNLAVSAWHKGYAKGPYALLWTSSESGERTALILARVDNKHGRHD